MCTWFDLDVYHNVYKSVYHKQYNNPKKVKTQNAIAY